MGSSALVVAMVAISMLIQGSRTFERVRTESPQLAQLMIRTHQQSATFRRIIATLEASDVVVYLAFGRCSNDVKACLQFISNADPNRYVLVKLDNFRSAPHELPGLLAHELHHAIEVSRAKAVVDSSSFLTFVTGKGPSSPPDREVLAQRIARDVEREINARKR
jgi:hypothetical protein